MMVSLPIIVGRQYPRADPVRMDASQGARAGRYGRVVLGDLRGYDRGYIGRIGQVVELSAIAA